MGPVPPSLPIHVVVLSKAVTLALSGEIWEPIFSANSASMALNFVLRFSVMALLRSSPNWPSMSSSTYVLESECAGWLELVGVDSLALRFGCGEPVGESSIASAELCSEIISGDCLAGVMTWLSCPELVPAWPRLRGE